MREELVSLKATIAEAKRFLKKAEDLRIRLDGQENPFSVYPLRERSAAKRASLDLTRSLAEFRRSRT